MGQPVSGLRDRFYRRLILDYRKEGVDSFLYRYFWTESVTELLQKHLPAYPGPVQPEDEEAVQERLSAAAKERLEPEPQTAAKKKADFWEELWLRDARVQAGLLSKADYFLWLAEYLAAHDIYYKDTSMWDGRLWLDDLLKKGLDWKKGTREPGHRELNSDRVYTAQLRKDLGQLVEEIGRDRARIAGWLDRLPEKYRSVLTARLKQMALHVKIKNWLQNSGYYLPTIREKDVDKEPFQKKSRKKQDFTLRMFEAYCASTGGVEFSAPDSGTDSGNWRLNDQGFCLLNTARLEDLQEALEEGICFYLPLGVDLRSGCVFFLAGKELYEELYEAGGKKAREAYEASPAQFCFDYLRLDGEHLIRFPWDVGGAFHLRPKFHENAGKSYQDVLDDFKRYCVEGDEREPGAGSPRETVRELNQERPARIPEEFCWAFDVPDGLEEASLEAAAAFERSRNRLERTAAPGRQGQLVKTSNIF